MFSLGCLLRHCVRDNLLCLSLVGYLLSLRWVFLWCLGLGTVLGLLLGLNIFVKNILIQRELSRPHMTLLTAVLPLGFSFIPFLYLNTPSHLLTRILFPLVAHTQGADYCLKSTAALKCTPDLKFQTSWLPGNLRISMTKHPPLLELFFSVSTIGPISQSPELLFPDPPHLLDAPEPLASSAIC